MRNVGPEVLSSERAAKASEILVGKRAEQVSKVLGAGEVLTPRKKLLVLTVHAMTWSYICADVYLAARRAWEEATRNEKGEGEEDERRWDSIGNEVHFPPRFEGRSAKTAIAGLDRVGFHLLATVYIPALVLDFVHWISSRTIVQYRLLETQPRARYWTPLVLTAAAVPIIFDPICRATDVAMDHTIRRLYVTKTADQRTFYKDSTGI